MLYDGGHGLVRILVMGVCGYFALMAILRLSGKRTLAKLNAFDFVVTIALGSTLASVLLSADVALAEGALAMGLLVTLQFVVAWASTRSSRVDRIVKSEPTLVYHHGFREPAMRKERVSADELRQVARAHGQADLHDRLTIVLETDGTFSVFNDHRE